MYVATSITPSKPVAAPLVKVKQAIQKLKQESTQMDIRIGVVQHILLQAKLREKTDKSRNPLITTNEYEAF